MTIRPVIWNKCKERFVCRLCLNEFDGFICEEIDGMAFETIPLFLIDHVVAVKTCGVSVGKGDPMIKRQLRNISDAKMKFSD